MYRNLLILCVLNALLLSLTLAVHGSLGPAWLALEAPWIIALLALVSDASRRRIAAVLAAALALLMLLALADGVGRLSLGRAFNPLLDASLADSAYHLMAQNLGEFPAVLITVAASGVPLLLAGLAYQGLRRVRPVSIMPRWGRFCSLALLTLSLPWLPAISASPRPIATPALDLVARHWRQAQETRIALADFRQRLNGKAMLKARALPGLAGRDVTLGFIESYGVSAIFDERYASRIRERLATMQQLLGEAGLYIATSRLTSPVQGGQSWLAHETALSGLWLTSQRHYDLLLAQDSPTLVDDFRATGQYTLAVMPAITAPWPEGKQLGYDRILAAKDIEYAGPALNWVTMPDQYTWRYYARVRDQVEEPLFGELALISSHAPWTPILPIIDDWEALGDGDIFMRWKDSGVTPQALWQDPQRVREHYARALDYALAAVTGYAERYQADGSLLIVLGDHQPAPLITGPNASRDVPIHVISSDPQLINAFIDAGFVSGTLPPDTPASRGLDDFRPLLHQLFDERD